jgi:hypothetical protein
MQGSGGLHKARVSQFTEKAGKAVGAEEEND